MVPATLLLLQVIWSPGRAGSLTVPKFLRKDQTARSLNTSTFLLSSLLYFPLPSPPPFRWRSLNIFPSPFQGIQHFYRTWDTPCLRWNHLCSHLWSEIRSPRIYMAGQWGALRWEISQAETHQRSMEWTLHPGLCRLRMGHSPSHPSHPLMTSLERECPFITGSGHASSRRHWNQVHAVRFHPLLGDHVLSLTLSHIQPKAVGRQASHRRDACGGPCHPRGLRPG